MARGAGLGVSGGLTPPRRRSGFALHNQTASRNIRGLTAGLAPSLIGYRLLASKCVSRCHNQCLKAVAPPSHHPSPIRQPHLVDDRDAPSSPTLLGPKAAGVIQGVKQVEQCGHMLDLAALPHNMLFITSSLRPIRPSRSLPLQLPVSPTYNSHSFLYSILPSCQEPRLAPSKTFMPTCRPTRRKCRG